MNATEFIVHAYPIQNEEFLLRFSHLTNYLDRYVARQNKLANIKGIPKENFYLPLSSRCNFFLIFDIFPTLPLPPSDPSVAPDTSVIISLVELHQLCSSNLGDHDTPKIGPRCSCRHLFLPTAP